MIHQSFAFETIEDRTIDSPKHCNFNETVFRRCELTGLWEHDNLAGAAYEDCIITATFVNSAGVE